MSGSYALVPRLAPDLELGEPLAPVQTAARSDLWSARRPTLGGWQARLHVYAGRLGASRRRTGGRCGRRPCRCGYRLGWSFRRQQVPGVIDHASSCRGIRALRRTEHDDCQAGGRLGEVGGVPTRALHAVADGAAVDRTGVGALGLRRVLVLNDEPGEASRNRQVCRSTKRVVVRSLRSGVAVAYKLDQKDRSLTCCSL
jgi:hypothetical protein